MTIFVHPNTHLKIIYMISRPSAQKKINYIKEYGIDKAIEHFEVSLESLKRYSRLIRHGMNDTEPETIDLPNILIFDIETAPMEVYVWGLYKQRINHDNVIEDWFVLSWSAKWLFSSEIMSDVLTPEEAQNGNDKRVCQSMWELFESADIVVAHNAQRFDIRKMNSRWILHKMKPPSPYQTIDTLKESRKMAAHSSHRLDYLGQILHNKGKIETDYSLWKRCKHGDSEALMYMEKYNKADVELLEEVYLSIRGWIKSHPNVGLYMETDEPVCANCGSDKIHEISEYVTPAGMYRAFRCDTPGCHAISRQRITAVPLAKRKNLMLSAAR